MQTASAIVRTRTLSHNYYIKIAKISQKYKIHSEIPLLRLYFVLYMLVLLNCICKLFPDKLD